MPDQDDTVRDRYPAKRSLVCANQGRRRRNDASGSSCARICSTIRGQRASRWLPDKRARLKAIADRLEEIRQEFDRNVRDNQTRLAFSPDEVKGLAAGLSRHGEARRQGQLSCSASNIRNTCRSWPTPRTRRRAAATSSRSRIAARRGTWNCWRRRYACARKWPTCSACRATPQFATRRRMVANPQTVDKFLRDVKSAVREVERREIAELTALKAGDRCTSPLARSRCSAGTSITTRSSRGRRASASTRKPCASTFRPKRAFSG